MAEGSGHLGRPRSGGWGGAAAGRSRSRHPPATRAHLPLTARGTNIGAHPRVSGLLVQVEASLSQEGMLQQEKSALREKNG